MIKNIDVMHIHNQHAMFQEKTHGVQIINYN